MRVKGGIKTRNRHNKYLKMAKGYRAGRGSLYRSAREAVERGLAFAYRDRKVRKREFRTLWITRINAAARGKRSVLFTADGWVEEGQRGHRSQGLVRHGHSGTRPDSLNWRKLPRPPFNNGPRGMDNIKEEAYPTGRRSARSPGRRRGCGRCGGPARQVSGEERIGLQSDAPNGQPPRRTSSRHRSNGPTRSRPILPGRSKIVWNLWKWMALRAGPWTSPCPDGGVARGIGIRYPEP